MISLGLMIIPIFERNQLVKSEGAGWFQLNYILLN